MSLCADQKAKKNESETGVTAIQSFEPSGVSRVAGATKACHWFAPVRAMKLSQRPSGEKCGSLISSAAHTIRLIWRVTRSSRSRCCWGGESLQSSSLFPSGENWRGIPQFSHRVDDQKDHQLSDAWRTVSCSLVPSP